MTRQQRQWHSRIWPLLAGLVALGVAVALWNRTGGLP